MSRHSTGPRLWLDKARQSWTIIDGRKSIRTGCRKGDLQTAKEVLKDYIAQHHVVTPGKDPLLADVLKIYAEEHLAGMASANSVASDMIRLEEWWGEKRASDVTKANCKLYITSRNAPTICRRELGFLNAALMYWHKEEEYGPLTSIPVIFKPPPPKARQRWMTRSEAAQMLWAMRRLKPNKRKRLQRFFIIGWYTGTRHAAISNTRWDMVDLKTGIMKRRQDGVAETKKRTPPVRAGQRLLGHLRRWKRIDGPKAIYIIQRGAHAANDMGQAWRDVRGLAGLPVDIVPHTLRHSRATHLMRQAVDPWQAAKSLGMDVEVLQDVYGHHHPDWQKDAAEAK